MGFVVAVCLAAPACVAGLDATPSAEAATFVSERHPETADSVGPYRVQLRQLLGPDATGGVVVYSVEPGSPLESAHRAEGRVPVRRSGQDGFWSAEIPGQPAGTALEYHFLLTNRLGAVVRHPARDPARYRFRIVPVQSLGVRLNRADARAQNTPRVELRLRAATRPAGELVVRPLPALDTPTEQHLPLVVKPAPDRHERPGTWLLSALLPELLPGSMADFYFELALTNGPRVRLPADAPNQLYSFKRSLLDVAPVASGDSLVTSLHPTDGTRWIGLRKGGLLMLQGGSLVRHWGIPDGLPSAHVRFVAAASEGGPAYVGTGRGVVMLEAEGGLPLQLLGPQRPMPGAEAGGGGLPMWNHRVGPGAVSALDGSLFFQVQREPDFEVSAAAAQFFEWRDGRLSQWRPPIPLAGVSAALFDPMEGCWLLGGFVGQEENLEPALVRRCGGQVAVLPLQPGTLGAARLLPQRVQALARDPADAALVLALEFRHAEDSARRPRFGVFRLDERSGQLSPLTPDLADLTEEVTALATDWEQRRILVGTFGRGLLAVNRGRAQPLARDDHPSEDITALAVDSISGLVLVGTKRGAFRLRGSRFDALPVSAAEALPPDSLPMDVHPLGHRVLLSSYRGGLFELEQRRRGDWRLARRLRAGLGPAVRSPGFSPLETTPPTEAGTTNAGTLAPKRDAEILEAELNLPAGLLGEARYTPDGEILAIVHSQGLLRVPAQGQPILLRTNDGLFSPHLQQLLVRRSGEVWVAHTPFPFGPYPGGAVQRIRDGRITRTVPIAGRDLATISRWLEVPERGSVFAATRAGVAEFADDGTINLLAGQSVAAIARGPATNALGAAGTSILRWDGNRFVPVLFQVDHPRWPPGRFVPGTPLDLAIGKTGRWLVLFSGGCIAVLDADGHCLGQLDTEDGVPATSQRLLAVPATDEVFVGSTEGLFRLKL